MSVSCCPAFHCILSNVCFSFSRLIQLMVRHIKDSVFKARSLLSHVWPLSLSPSHSQFLLLTCSRLLLSPFTARHLWVSSSVPLGQCNATLVFLWVFLWFLGGLGGVPLSLTPDPCPWFGRALGCGPHLRSSVCPGALLHHHEGCNTVQRAGWRSNASRGLEEHWPGRWPLTSELL